MTESKEGPLERRFWIAVGVLTIGPIALSLIVAIVASLTGQGRGTWDAVAPMFVFGMATVGVLNLRFALRNAANGKPSWLWLAMCLIWTAGFGGAFLKFLGVLKRVCKRHNRHRLLVGGEIVQFACTEQTSPTGWRLGGLLRGRGGTEFAAMAGHLPGASVVLIDETLIPIDPGQVSSGAGTAISAIGHGDEEPVQASLTNSGSTLRPLAPVHPITCPHGTGGAEFRWTRRARGAWLWLDDVDAPLVEQSELYHVGVGPVGAPLANWTVAEPRLLLSATEKNQLQSDYPGLPVWVRQIGSHAQSNALLLPVLE